MLVDHIGMRKLRDMASKSDRLVSDIRLTDLPRIAALLYPDFQASDQQIRLRFDFRRDTQGLPEISGSASGFIDLQCQRCLGSLHWPVELAFRLTVAQSEAEVAKSSEPFDAVLAIDGSISLLELTEDEMLASLPLAPMHENLVDCKLSDLLGSEAVNTLQTIEVDDMHGTSEVLAPDVRRPFEGLSLLLKQKNDPGRKKHS